MTIRSAFDDKISIASERLMRLAQWFHEVLLGPPLDHPESLLREDDDTVFQRRDLTERGEVDGSRSMDGRESRER